MDAARDQADRIPGIERLKVKNFRALRDVEIKNLTPLTVLVGPNGAGKSTVFEVIAFLAECFGSGLRRAWQGRSKAPGIRSKDGEGPVSIEITYRERQAPLLPPITYHLEVDEKQGRPFVAKEWLRWRQDRGGGRPFRFLDYNNGKGFVISGERPAADAERIKAPLSSPDTLAVNALGQLAKHPRIAALRNFVTGWWVSRLSSENIREYPLAGPRERLNETGDNLANVIQHLSEEHPARLDDICKRLSARIPRIRGVSAETMPDESLLLQIRDVPFDEPTLAHFASDGTLKMLAYLILLHDPHPPPFIGIEEPENFLHPRLLYGLAEEYVQASAETQILVTTHSPFFLDALHPEEVHVLWRDRDGYTKCHSLGRDKKIKAFMDSGVSLGDLWMRGFFEAGDPLTNEGMPRRRVAMS